MTERTIGLIDGQTRLILALPWRIKELLTKKFISIAETTKTSTSQDYAKNLKNMQIQTREFKLQTQIIKNGNGKTVTNANSIAEV